MLDERLIYRGSVKDIYQTSIDEELLFYFSDRYSVFDWGEMPDHIEGKGRALASMGKMLFDYFSKSSDWSKLACPKKIDSNWFAKLTKTRGYHHLCAQGLDSHYVGADSLRENCFRVTKTRVLSPVWTGSSYHYWRYHNHPTHALVPLEVIFRFGVPEGSSLLDRAKDQGYLRTLGIDSPIAPGMYFTRPIVEFSTKLEKEDRYLNYGEAQKIAGLSSEELDDLVAQSLSLACSLKNLFDSQQLELWDGKFEFAFSSTHQYPNRRFVLVDSIGIDELRVMSDGVQLSKEFLRQYYRKTPWYQQVVEAKKIATSLNRLDWQQFCRLSPEPLPHDLKLLARDMYFAVHDVLALKFGQHKLLADGVKPQSIFKAMRSMTL